LFRFFGKLLVVLEALLRVGDIFLESALGIIVSQRGQSVTVEFLNVFEIFAVRESVLGDDDVALAVAGVVEQLGYPTAIVRAADIDHPWSERVEDGMAVIEQLLPRPLVDLFGHAVGVNNRGPNLVHARRPAATVAG